MTDKQAAFILINNGMNESAMLEKDTLVIENAPDGLYSEYVALADEYTIDLDLDPHMYPPVKTEDTPILDDPPERYAWFCNEVPVDIENYHRKRNYQLESLSNSSAEQTDETSSGVRGANACRDSDSSESGNSSRNRGSQSRAREEADR